MRPGRCLAPVLPTAGLLLLGGVDGAGWDVPFDSVAAFTDWAGTTAPVPLAMALVRLAAQVICGYLLLATVLPVLAEALGYRWLHTLATRAVPTVLRRTVTGGAGLGLAAGSILWTNASPAGAGLRPTVELVARHEEPPARPTASMTLLQPPPLVPTTVELTTRDEEPSAGPTAAMTLLQPTQPDATAVELIARDEEPSARPTATMTLLEPEASDATAVTMTLLEPASSGATATMRLLEPAPETPDADHPPTTEPGNRTPEAGRSPTSDPGGRTSGAGRPPTTDSGGGEPGAGRPPASAAGSAPGAPGAAPSGGPSRLASTLEPLPKVAGPEAMVDETWVVESGDSFWSIAEDVVGIGAATDAYWHQLIAANRDRLAVPDQPDLLFPGQILTLPRPTSPEVS